MQWWKEGKASLVPERIEVCRDSKERGRLLAAGKVCVSLMTGMGAAQVRSGEAERRSGLGSGILPQLLPREMAGEVLGTMYSYPGENADLEPQPLTAAREVRRTSGTFYPGLS